MRLVGYSFVRSDGPLPAGYLPLGDLTVVVGANDVGKTRLLSGMAAHLSRMPTGDPGDEDAVFFVELFETGLASLTELTEAEPPPVGAAFSARLRVASEEEVTSASESRTIALVEGHGGYTAEAFRCAPPSDDPAAYSGSRLSKAFESLPELLGASALWIEGAPIPVLPVDVTKLPDLPSPIQLPIPTDTLVDTAIEATASLVAAASVIQECVTSVGDGGDADFDGRFDSAGNLTGLFEYDEFLEDRLHENHWLVEPDVGGHSDIAAVVVRLAEPVEGVVTLLQGTANQVLPKFISDAYELAVGLRLPSWEARRPFDLHLVNKGPEVFEFPLDEAAEGFRLWIQLAVLEGVDAVRLQEAILWFAAEAVSDAGVALMAKMADLETAQAADDDTQQAEAREAVDVADEDLRERLDELREQLRNVSTGVPVDLPERREAGIPRSAWESMADGMGSGCVRTRQRQLRPRFYLIDEPERHLHPRLQREASKWLAQTMAERRSQCIIATHATPFMNLSQGTQYVALRRNEDGVARLDAFSPEHVTALSEFAGELGFNRGQLLATVNLVLFVEGRADQRVLEALFLKRFFEAGITVVPLQGALKAPQVIDADVLLRYSSAKAAVLLDDLPIETVNRLQNDDLFRHESLKASSITLSKMAQLVESARIHGRIVQPFGLPGHDIFSVLDEQVLMEEYPDFPGHEAALQAWRDSGEKSWKEFFREHYKVPDEIEMYIRIADRMRERDAVPAALLALVDDIERYAFS